MLDILDAVIHGTAEILDDPEKTVKAAVEVAEVVSVVTILDDFFD